MKWRWGGSCWRTSRGTLSWRGRLVCALVSCPQTSVSNLSLSVINTCSSPPVKISLDRVQDTWEKTSGPFQVKRLAEHYGVFRDLFPMAYFLPQVTIHVSYHQDNSGQVHYGNRLTPTEVCWKDRIRIYFFCLCRQPNFNIFSCFVHVSLFRQHPPPRSASMQRRVPCGPFCSPLQVRCAKTRDSVKEPNVSLNLYILHPH